MRHKKHTFKNGLRLITVPIPNVASATVMILVSVGSRYEEARVNGITHFLEHMFFKGTKKRPTARSISTEIDSIGGEFNASTGKENTAYFVKALGTHLDTAFDVLCDMLLNSKLAPREIEREKRVIAEEIAMYEDLPMRKVAEDFEALLFPNSSLGWDIAGKVETVKNVSRKDFQELVSRFYQPENMVVVVSGGFDERKARSLARKYLGARKKKKAGEKREKERFVQKHPEVLLKSKKTEQTHLVLGVRGNPRGHPDRYVEEVLVSLLGGGMSSRLFLAVREKRGLAYYVKAEVDHYRDNGYLAASAGVEPKRLEEAVKVIISEFVRIREGKGLSKKELTKAKEFVKGHLALSLEDTKMVAGFYGSYELLEGEVVTPEEVFAGIDKVAKEDVMRVAKEFFRPERLNLAVIGLHQDSEKLKKLLKL